MKKIISILILFVLPSILYIGCCKCAEGPFHRSLTSIRLLEYSRTNIVSNDTLKVIDTVNLYVNVIYKLVAQNKPNELLKLTNSAYAFSCNCLINDLGYLKPIDSIKITSNNSFNNIPAGQNLSPFFKARSEYTQQNTTINYFPIQQVIDSVNSNKRLDYIYLINNTIPQVNKTHKFTFTIYTGGEMYQSTTKGFITWQ